VASSYPFVPLACARLTAAGQRQRSAEFLPARRTVRSMREFSPEPVSFELIENAIRAAASAPSGANRQPWRFVVVRDPVLKREIDPGGVSLRGPPCTSGGQETPI
jgi:nitroreductase